MQEQSCEAQRLPLVRFHVSGERSCPKWRTFSIVCSTTQQPRFEPTFSLNLLRVRRLVPTSARGRPPPTILLASPRPSASSLCGFWCFWIDQALCDTCGRGHISHKHWPLVHHPNRAVKTVGNTLRFAVIGSLMMGRCQRASILRASASGNLNLRRISVKAVVFTLRHSCLGS